jgi:hypothetical protein
MDENLPDFPAVVSPLQLTGYVDAAHANDLRNRRSTTGYGFTVNGVGPRGARKCETNKGQVPK